MFEPTNDGRGSNRRDQDLLGIDRRRAHSTNVTKRAARSSDFHWINGSLPYQSARNAPSGSEQLIGARRASF